MNNDCDVTDDQLWDLLDEDVSDAGSDDLRAHIAECTNCGQRIDRMRVLHSGLESVVPLDPAPLPEWIGPYRILGLVGRGGMGVVYEAEQENPARRVAVKVMQPTTEADEHRVRAFRREIEALGRLRHPSIATIYDAGRTDEGLLYLVMELVAGKPLDKFCEGSPLPLRSRVELAQCLAQAVHHAHQRGVIHRDLKPQNVLVDDAGVLHVLDFGLARFLTSELDVTISQSGDGSPAGTVPYMSPEQLRGEPFEVDVRTDVYAIGVMLYLLLTDTLPYECRTLHDALRTLADRVPRHPSSVAPDVPRELGDVVIKAIANDPEQRYESAAALADDLSHFLTGEAVSARPASVVYRLRVFARRHRKPLTTALVVTLVALVSVLLAIGGRDAASNATNRLLQEFPRFDPVRRFDVSPDGRWIVSQARNGFLQISEADGAIIRPLETDSGLRLRGRLPRWSPDGVQMAYVSGGRRIPGDSGPAVFVIESENGTPRQIGPISSNITDLCWKPDGRQLTCLDRNEGIYSLDLVGGKRDALRPAVDDAVALGGYSSDGRWLAMELGDQFSESDVWIVAAEGGQAIRLTDAPGRDSQVTWGRGGRTLYFVSNQGDFANIWKQSIDPGSGLRDGEPQQVTNFIHAHPVHPRMLADGRRMVFGTTRIRTEIRAGSRPSDEAWTLARGRSPQLSPDGKKIYYLGEGPDNRGVFVVSKTRGVPETERLTESSPSPAKEIYLSLQLSSDGRTLAYTSRARGETRLFALPTSGGKPKLLVQAKGKRLLVSWSPDGSRLAYVDDRGLYVIPASGGPRREVTQTPHWFRPEWSPDGERIAAVGYLEEEKEYAVFVFSASGRERLRLTAPEERGIKEGLVWHPDGDRLTYVRYLTSPTTNDTELREVYLDGRSSTLLFNRPEYWDYLGKWAPDGTNFFFCSSQARVWKLWRYDARSVEFFPVATKTRTMLPSWSGDGKTMVWQVVNRFSHLWLMENFR